MEVNEPTTDNLWIKSAAWRLTRRVVTEKVK